MSALSRRSQAYLLLAMTPLVPWLGGLPGGRWLLPLVAPLTVYFAFLNRVRFRDYLGAWSLGLAWAALYSAGVILLVELRPELAARAVLHGEPYRQEMFRWVATGIGPEGSWRLFLPIHLEHLAAFVALAWLSAGYLGLVLGTLLVGYMSYFVGSYAAASGHPLLGVLAAWVPWSVARVLAFVLLGSLFARPWLVRRAWPFERREYQLLLLAASGLLLDVLVKAFLAPRYGLFLHHLAEGLLR